jgi:hypothetical protein
MPWQRLVADIGTEVDADGLPRYPVVVVTVPRQSGKTTLLRALAVHRLLTTADASVWLTAQRRNDARDTWSQAVRLVERSRLAGAVTVRRTNGSEALSVPRTGSEFRVFAPAEDALHGKTTDLVCVDEGWAFTAERGAQLMQAIVPTQATRPHAQVWIVSTAGTDRSTWLRDYVDRARAALADGAHDELGFAYFEWSIPDGADVADPAVYAAHHPALGHTITGRALAAAQTAMDGAEFARAYGNRWTGADAFLVDPAEWDTGRTRDPIAPASPVAFAVEITPDRAHAYIVAAGRTADGRRAVEIADHGPDTDWVFARLCRMVDRWRPVAVDPIGPARMVLTAAQRRRSPIPLVEITAGRYCEAWGDLVDGLHTGTVQHRAHARLDAAAASATGRIVHEQVVISRAGHAAPLVAAMLAAYALDNPATTTPAPALRVARPDANPPPAS